MRIRLCALLALFGTILLVRPSAAQDEGLEDQAAQIAQLFGQGQSIHGVVTVSEAGSFLVRTDEGESFRVLYSPNTHVMKDRQLISANDIRVGDMLAAAGDLDSKAKTLGAVFLYDVDATEGRKVREGFGKTWTAGKVKSIHDLKITIERADDQKTQIVAVDENTSFRSHDESVTLGDIKVGDFISAQGALHSNTFLAAILRVMEPGADHPKAGNLHTRNSGASSAGQAPPQRTTGRENPPAAGSSESPQARLTEPRMEQWPASDFWLP